MGRVRKPKLEGEASALVPLTEQERHISDGAEAFRPADPVPGDNGAALARIADYFRAKFPDEWEGLKLCPLQHGLDTMVERLKA